MAEKIEEKFQDVIQNIEFGLIGAYREHEKLTDYGADYVVETLVKQYTAELLARTPPPLPKFPLHEKDAYDRVKAMCDLRLGRGQLEDKSGQPLELGGDLGLEDMIACLKRIRTSIQFWTKRRGRRGYYDYVKNYVQ
jgi:hypothetical protein